MSDQQDSEEGVEAIDGPRTSLTRYDSQVDVYASKHRRMRRWSIGFFGVTVMSWSPLVGAMVASRFFDVEFVQQNPLHITIIGFIVGGLGTMLGGSLTFMVTISSLKAARQRNEVMRERRAFLDEAEVRGALHTYEGSMGEGALSLMDEE